MSVVATRNSQGVIYYDERKACNGYTIITPLYSGDVWLIDMYGRVVHCWHFPQVGLYAKILKNGNLLFQGRPVQVGLAAQGRTTVPPTEQKKFQAMFDEKRFFAGGVRLRDLGGSGGIMLEVDWEGNLVHKYLYPRHHHDVDYVDETEHLFVLGFEDTPPEIAAKIKGGIPGTEMNGKIIADGIQEVDWTGEVYWGWSAYQHLDPELDVICPLEPRREWTHTNAVRVLPDGDILISCRDTCSLYIIDRNTGAIKWRWGYGEVWHQHDSTLVENGNILCFDNGAHRLNSHLAYSRIVEVNPKTNEIEWEYKADPPTNFYSAVMSGCQRLPNGNTLICSTDRGRVFEVTRDKEVVWSCIVPFYGPFFVFGCTNAVYRAYRYTPDYEGLKGKTLDPEKYQTVNRAIGVHASH